jgi:Xaa-Pro aminopeptidase
MIKTDKEIRFIRKSCLVTDACFSELLPNIHVGVTEQELNRKLNQIFVKHNVKPAFPPIVAFGKHTSIVHYMTSSASDTRCRKNEIILLDFGVKVNGYCSDMTRMVFAGTPKEEWVNAYNVIIKIQQSCLDKIQKLHTGSFPGARLDKYTRSQITKFGLPPYPHGLGHNLGIIIHELPRLSRRKPAKISHGMAFTIEPGTYIKNTFGIRIEDTVYWSQNGLEILTKTPKKLIII